MIKDLEEREDLPSALVRIVGIDTDGLATEGSAPESTASATYHDEVEETLLSKPANPEQVRIVRQLDHSAGVLVQGPPGTGKSHTIANLIGHLLAHGKTVLVTAHTTKALRVLRNYVAEALQPLCVSVLDNDLEGRKQLEQSVEGIAARGTGVRLQVPERTGWDASATDVANRDSLRHAAAFAALRGSAYFGTEL